MALIQSLDVAPIGRPSQSGSHIRSICSFLRPADTAPYAVGDVISDSTSVAKALVFPNTGRSGIVLHASAVIVDAGAPAFELYLFNEEPTNHLDNAGIGVALAFAHNYVGRFLFLAAARSLIGSNLNFYEATQSVDGPTGAARDVRGIPYVTDSGALYGLVRSLTTHTPTNAGRHTFSIGCRVD